MVKEKQEPRYIAFAERLASRLPKPGLSGPALEKESGVPRQRMDDFLHGENLPGAENLVKIAQYTRTPLDWLLTGRRIPVDTIDEIEAGVPPLGPDEQATLADVLTILRTDSKERDHLKWLISLMVRDRERQRLDNRNAKASDILLTTKAEILGNPNLTESVRQELLDGIDEAMAILRRGVGNGDDDNKRESGS